MPKTTNKKEWQMPEHIKYGDIAALTKVLDKDYGESDGALFQGQGICTPKNPS